MLETTALGAAFAAGIGVGFWTAGWVLHEAQEQHQQKTDFYPEEDRETIQQRYRNWQQAVERSYNLDGFTNCCKR